MTDKSCGDAVPEAALRLADGGLAPVRVVRVGESLLFVPNSWFHPAAFDVARETSWGGYSGISPRFTQQECAGLIHVLAPSGRLILMIGSRRPDSGGRDAPTFVRGYDNLPDDFPVFRLELRYGSSRQTVRASEPRLGPSDQFGWAQVGKGNDFVSVAPGDQDTLNSHFVVASPYLSSVRNGSARPSTFPNRASHQPLPGVVISYQWSERKFPSQTSLEAPVAQPQWRELRGRMTRLTKWLATAPSSRTSDQFL